MENGVMHAGQHVMIADGQQHAVHAGVHIESMELLIQMANQLYQASPAPSGIAAMIKTQQYLQICVPHTQAHLQLLAEDKVHQNEFQALRTRMGSMQNYVKQIDAIVQQGQEQQAGLANAQQGAQTKEQIKLQQAQAEIGIERAMAASKISNQQAKTMSQIQMAQAKAARPVNPRQALMQEVAQSNALTSPVQPAPGGMSGGMGGPEAGYEQLPLE
jgi:hypothetical protein